MKVSAMRNDERFPLLVEVVTGDTMGIRRGGDEQLAVRIQEIDAITDKINEQKAKTGNRPPGFAVRVFDELNIPAGKERGQVMAKIEELVATGQATDYEDALRVLKTS